MVPRDLFRQTVHSQRSFSQPVKRKRPKNTRVELRFTAKVAHYLVLMISHLQTVSTDTAGMWREGRLICSFSYFGCRIQAVTRQCSLQWSSGLEEPITFINSMITPPTRFSR